MTRTTTGGRLLAVLSLTAACAAPGRADFSAIRLNPGFDSNTLARNDDLSTGLVNVGFNGNFFGQLFTQVYVNNNGNVTFTAPLGTFTPFGLAGTNTRIIAPFFADVDTRGTLNGSQPVRYGTSTVDGRNAFGVNWALPDARRFVDGAEVPAADEKPAKARRVKAG